MCRERLAGRTEDIMDGKIVVLAGASGVVGSEVLGALLSREEIGQVVSVGRRAPPLRHDRLVSKIVDLHSAIAIAPEIPDGSAAAICCLGTTMKKAGSKDAFRAVDHDAVVAFAEAARGKDVPRFLVVSSIGADPGARTFYLRTKGETEEALRRLGFPQLTIVRPSFIDDRGTRPEHRLGERLALPLARAIFSVVGKTSRYAPIGADTIARAMVALAFDPIREPVRIVESDALHEIGK